MPEPLTKEDLENLAQRLDTLDRRLEVVEEMERQEPWHGNAIDFLSTMNGSPAFIVDEGVARATPCVEVDLSPGSSLTFSKGAVGPLDEAQRAAYCPSTVKKQPTEKQRERLAHFKAAAESCRHEVESVPAGERTQPWLACMSRELRQHGVKL